MNAATDPNWWAIGLLLGVCGWTVLGIYLMVWRQPNDDTFLIAMILWASVPLWVWFTPFSPSLRQIVVGFWHGMDWKPRKDAMRSETTK